MLLHKFAAIALNQLAARPLWRHQFGGVVQQALGST